MKTFQQHSKINSSSERSSFARSNKSALKHYSPEETQDDDESVCTKMNSKYTAIENPS